MPARVVFAYAAQEFVGREHQSSQAQGDQPAEVALDGVEEVLSRHAARLAGFEEEESEEALSEDGNSELPRACTGPLLCRDWAGQFRSFPYRGGLHELDSLDSSQPILGVAQGFAAEQFLTDYRFFPKGFGVGLLGVYMIWIAVVLVLYPFCKWVAAVKARRQDRLSYV